MNKNESEHNTKDKIPKHRKEFIDISLKKFIKDYGIKKWPLDCVSLIDAIVKRGSIRLCFKRSRNLKEDQYAKTIYVPGLDKYLMVINEEKLSHPFGSPMYQNMNSALALELAHIILKHSDLPDGCKDELQRELENLEAEDFADKLLTPKGRAASSESRDNEPYYIKPLSSNVNDCKYGLSEILSLKHYDDTLVLRLQDWYMKVLFFLYCLTVLGTYINW